MLNFDGRYSAVLRPRGPLYLRRLHLATLATSEGDEEGIGGTHGAASVGRRCSGAGSYGCGGCYHGARR